MFNLAILSNPDRSLGISLGLIGGMVVGSLIGRNIDNQATVEGKVL